MSRLSVPIYLPIAFIFILASCGHGNFTKQKFTNLKPLEAEYASVESEKEGTTSFDKQSSQITSESVEMEESNTMYVGAESNQEEFEQSNVRSFVVEDDPSIAYSEHIYETPVEVEKPFKKFLSRPLDEDEKMNEDDMFTLVLVITILAAILGIAGLLMASLGVGFGEPILFVIGMILLLLAAILGVMDFVFARKLKKNQTKRKSKVMGIIGMIAGWVIFGLALLNGLILSLEWIFF